ncbi:MAG: ATP-binding cassette domain-containing protein [Pseudomonadota bacterium]|nr:ATP-binding cassette domain-containing protein [Pseudomonadota bacterium]
MKELFARLKYRPIIFAEMSLASLLASILGLASSLFVIQVLNRYVTHGVDATLTTLAIGTIIAIFFELGFRQVRLNLAAIVNAPFNESLSNSSFALLTGAKSSAFDSLAIGLRQQIITAADTIQNAYSAPNVAAIFDVPFALIFVGVLFLLSPPIAITVLIFLVTIFLISILTLASLRRPISDVTIISSKRNALISSAIDSADTIRVFNAQGFIKKQWRNETDIFQKLLRIVAARQGLLGSIGTSTQALMSVAVITLGAVLVVKGQLDIGGMIGANILASRALGPILKFAQMGESLAKAQQAKVLLQEFSKIPLERKEGSSLGQFNGRMEFQDIAFSYPGQRAPLFESLSLKLEPGSLLPFSGANGTGKTTLARIIVGLLEPTRGKILIDGVDMAQVAPEWWRQQIIYLPQEPSFLRATIRENLQTIGKTLDDAKLNELARTAGLKTFIDQSPDGFDTQIKNNGADLSLGIRRRIALARALASDGMLVVIDDPTEGLDAEGAEVVWDALKNLSKRGRTVIVFSHDSKIFSAAPYYMNLNTKPVPRLIRKETAPSKSSSKKSTKDNSQKMKSIKKART